MLDKIMFISQILLGGILIYRGLTGKVRKDDGKLFKYTRVIHVVAGALIILFTVYSFY